MLLSGPDAVRARSGFVAPRLRSWPGAANDCAATMAASARSAASLTRNAMTALVAVTCRMVRLPATLFNATSCVLLMAGWLIARVRVAASRVTVTAPGVTVPCRMAGDRATLFRVAVMLPGVTVACRVVRVRVAACRVAACVIAG